MAITIDGTNGLTTDTGALKLDGTTLVVDDTNNRVGIGTNSPTGKLNVVTDNTHNGGVTFDSTGTTQLWLRDTDATSNQRNWGFQISGGSFNLLRANDDRASGFVTPIEIQQAPANSLTIFSNGVASFNTSSVVGAERLGVRFDGSTVNGIGIETTSSSSGDGFMIFRNASSTAIGTISRNGGTNAVLYNTTSDYRLKENITPLTNALDRVSALNPVQWTWKDCDGSTGEGFIAHEVQAIVPSAVSGEKDAVDSEGNIKPQGMDASYLVALLTKAIQEQQQTIESLEARITALESA